ncbi:hypothetical protein B0H13DRAFT_1894232 [Mycena leptocephala]|nr:hypothetical protein B0H13DRAFT_1894232 [Mycena leptocephala]
MYLESWRAKIIGKGSLALWVSEIKTKIEGAFGCEPHQDYEEQVVIHDVELNIVAYSVSPLNILQNSNPKVSEMGFDRIPELQKSSPYPVAATPSVMKSQLAHAALRDCAKFNMQVLAQNETSKHDDHLTCTSKKPLPSPRLPFSDFGPTKSQSFNPVEQVWLNHTHHTGHRTNDSSGPWGNLRYDTLEGRLVMAVDESIAIAQAIHTATLQVLVPARASALLQHDEDRRLGAVKPGHNLRARSRLSADGAPPVTINTFDKTSLRFVPAEAGDING